jgi:hypothetical protein
MVKMPFLRYLLLFGVPLILIVVGSAHPRIKNPVL